MKAEQEAKQEREKEQGSLPEKLREFGEDRVNELLERYGLDKSDLEAPGVQKMIAARLAEDEEGAEEIEESEAEEKCGADGSATGTSSAVPADFRGAISAAHPIDSPGNCRDRFSGNGRGLPQ